MIFGVFSAFTRRTTRRGRTYPSFGRSEEQCGDNFGEKHSHVVVLPLLRLFKINDGLIPRSSYSQQ